MACVQSRVLFITGTDTGVGKTVVTCLLARHFRRTSQSVAALKPICSGNRADATALHAALEGTLSLDEINPWHFRASVAPLLAARREKRKLGVAEVVAHIRGVQKRFPTVLVEGAGGLLSPLGEGFSSLDLIVRLRATPIVVCPNRLGAINQVLLVLAALPRGARRARVALVSPPFPGTVHRSNQELISEMIGPERVATLPWIAQPGGLDRALRRKGVATAIGTLLS
jgi:dethiobiotin synthetase